jgi:hypothetical protein
MRLAPIDNARLLELELPEQKPRPKSTALSMTVAWLQMLVLPQNGLEMDRLAVLLHISQPLEMVRIACKSWCQIGPLALSLVEVARQSEIFRREVAVTSISLESRRVSTDFGLSI